MTTSGMAPYRDTWERVMPALAVGTTQSAAVDAASQTGRVVNVTYTPTATITGAATNTRLVQLVNRGQAGAGTTVIASLQFDAGVNATAYDERVIPVTVANATVAQDDVMEWRSTAVGTGIADPGGMVRVDLDRT